MLARITGNLARFVLSIIAAGENATDEVVDSLDRQFGTDRPAAIQYWDWFSRLWPGDFGVSCLSRTDICALVADKVQVSLTLVILVILAIAVRAASQLGAVVPGFPLGIVLVSFFAFRPGWLPANGWVSPRGEDFGAFVSRLVLSVVALAGVPSAILACYVRSAGAKEPLSALNPLVRVGAHVPEVMEVHSTVPGRAAAKKRVMIAMALANDPQLLLCAEPTTALDVTVQSKVLELISAQVSERGTGFLFITHGLTVVVNMCTRVLVLDKGPLVESGDIDRLITDPDHP